MPKVALYNCSLRLRICNVLHHLQQYATKLRKDFPGKSSQLFPIKLVPKLYAQPFQHWLQLQHLAMGLYFGSASGWMFFFICLATGRRHGFGCRSQLLQLLSWSYRCLHNMQQLQQLAIICNKAKKTYILGSMVLNFGASNNFCDPFHCSGIQKMMS